MQSEISVLKEEIQHYEALQNECADIIKGLTDFPPTKPITISIKADNVPLASMTVTEEGAGNFTLSFFMSWHSFYNQQIKHRRRVLAALEAQYPIAC